MLFLLFKIFNKAPPIYLIDVFAISRQSVSEFGKFFLFFHIIYVHVLRNITRTIIIWLALVFPTIYGSQNFLYVVIYQI